DDNDISSFFQCIVCLLSGLVPILPGRRVEKLCGSTVAGKKRAINRMTSTIEGLRHEFQFNRRATQPMNQQDSKAPPFEEYRPVGTIKFWLPTHAEPSKS